MNSNLTDRPLPESRASTFRQAGSEETDGNVFTHSSLPRRSQSERVQQSRPPPDLEHDLPPLPQAEMSSDARRQSIMAMDRKRRLTTSAQDTGRRRTTTGGFTSRDNRYYPTAHRRNSQRSSHSSSVPIEPRQVVDLTGFSPMQPPSARIPPSPRSRGYVVPKWQSDSEVAECPICHRPFGFLFRRHHCRKCGRVVCNDCSPHRITIPRQYIVHPPGAEEAHFTSSDIPTMDLTGGEEEDDEERATGLVIPRLHSDLGGGEKVRLCNPCVPDPQPELQAVLREGPSRMPFMGNDDGMHSAPPNLISFPRVQHYSPQQPQRPGARVHVDMNDETALPQIRYNPGMHSRYHSLDSRQAPLPPLPPFTGQPRHASGMDSFSRAYGTMPLPPSASPRPVPLSMASSSSQPHIPHHRPPRLRIREEDMCPICRGMLPPKGPNGEEAEREAHVMQCISLHDSSASSAARTQSASLPNANPFLPPSLPQLQPDPRSMMRTFGASGPTLNISSMSPPPPPQPQPQPQRLASTAMLRFIATEKDCGPSENTDGQNQECSICMVEYEVGDRLARLECWCKFHDECIVSWFARRAECPVHKVS